jgi:hypothetical protein
MPETDSKFLKVQKRIAILEIAGFLALLALTWVNLDLVLPILSSRLPAFQSDLVASLIQTALVLFLAAFILYAQFSSMRRIKLLEGLLPVCAFCKRIRADGRWTPIEEYIRDHSEAEFSHGFCPDCGRKHYEGFLPKGK